MTDTPPTPEEIKALRDRLGLTQLEFAGWLIGATDQEIDRAREIISMLTNVRLWESGKRAPGTKHGQYADLLRSRTTR